MTLVDDLLIALRFFSRLPVPETERERSLGAAGLASAAALVPVAGAIIGILPAFVLLAAGGLGLPPVLAAPLAIATLALVTGALHEDALSDCADGFGGGRTRERKLEIMRDSRIGAFGGVALALSLYVRVTALAVIADRSAGTAALVLVAAAALSRAASLWPLAWLPPARAEGVGAAAQPAPAVAGAAAARSRWSSRWRCSRRPPGSPARSRPARSWCSPPRRFASWPASRSKDRRATSPARRNSSPRSPSI